MDIRESLKHAVEASGLKQNAIAKRANITPSQLSSILGKKRRMDVNELVSICRAINVSPEKLMSVDQNQAS